MKTSVDVAVIGGGVTGVSVLYHYQTRGDSDFRIDYNMNRPHTAHGDLTPTEFARQWNADNQQKVA